MASPNTLKIRNIGLVPTKRFVKQPHKETPVLLERLELPHRVIHNNGTRYGSFDTKTNKA